MQTQRLSNPARTIRDHAKTLLATALTVVLLGSVGTVHAADGDVVLIRGITIDDGLFFVADVGRFQGTVETAQLEKWKAAACENKDLIKAADIVSTEIAVREYAAEKGISPDEAWDEDGSSIRYKARARLGERLKTCDERPEPIQSFTIIYASCAMYMQQNGQQMMITLPPSTNGAVMELRAPGETPMRINLTTQFERGRNIARMNNGGAQVTPTGKRGTHLGIATREYATEYQATTNMNMLVGMDLPNMGGIGDIKVVSHGTAWLAPSAPGLDVVRGFYRKFAEEVRVPGMAEAFLSGLVEQMSRITEKGMPMLLEQTITSSVRAPMFNVGKAGMSLQVITGIGVLPRSAAPKVVADLCNSSLIRKGEKVQDLNQMMAGVEGATNPGKAPTVKAQTEMQRAMQEASKAMEGLDPATRAMMEKMGIAIPGMPASSSNSDD